jgi:hypothetical protein
MKQSTLDRARFVPRDKTRLWAREGDKFEIHPWNPLAHISAHGTMIWTYTSKATLDTTISTPWYPPTDFVIESVQANVTGAPSGTALVWDVLIGGNSIFANTAERPQIQAGDLVGRLTVPSRQGLPAGSKLQVQGVTLSSATGPLVLTFQLTAVSG